MMALSGFNWLRIVSCEDGINTSGPIKGDKFSYQLNDCQLLSKDSGTWNLISINCRWRAVMS